VEIPTKKKVIFGLHKKTKLITRARNIMGAYHFSVWKAAMFPAGKVYIFRVEIIIQRV
jgi:hypothetical protein